MNDYYIFWTLNNICTNEKFDLMYGWYGHNAQIMWKIDTFWWFSKMIFGTFGAQKWPHILLQTPCEWLSYLWDTQSCMYQWEKWFNVWVIWLWCPKYVKNSHFLVILENDFGTFVAQIGPPYPTPDALWMNISSLRHSIMHVPTRNLI